MPTKKSMAVALTIAGSDSGGGAGVQADLKTFAALGVHGTSAITCVTAQNPQRVIGIEACSRKIIGRQIEAVFEGLAPFAVKTGMLFSSEIIHEVARALRRHGHLLVIDPVMIATSGARLLKPDAVKALVNKLFPLATLITPNIPEAEALLGFSIRAPADLRIAARALHERHGCAALVKGGHLISTAQATDIFFDGRSELELSSPRIRHVKTHGTGCTYSAAITAYLAKGEKLPRAVKLAKDFVTSAITNIQQANRQDVLGFLSPAKEPGGRRG